MKKARLDQILFKSGKLTEELLRKALLRQKSRGGKLGTHLLYFGVFSENELVAALSEQYQVPGVRLSGEEIPQEILKRLTASAADELVALPFRFDKATGELHVAVADPEKPNALAAIQRACGTPNVVLHVAPDIILRQEIDRNYHGRERSPGADRAVDLPELFGEPGKAPAAVPDAVGESAAAVDSVLLFTRQAYLKNVLPSLFERERLRLLVAGSPGELAESMKTADCTRVLVSEECREEFDRLAGAPERAGVFPETSYFRTVGSSLLDNPVPYDRMFDCLITALQAVAAIRSPAGQGPMALISNDIVEVGRVLHLPRLAIDGLRIGACLLVPALQENEAPGETVRTISNQFFDLDTSVETARQLAFPWDVADCLKALKNALAAEEMPIVSGVLSLVWYRHHALSPLRAGSGGELEELKSRLRAQAGRLAPSAVVEAYIRVLEQSDQAVGIGQDVFFVGEGDPVPSALLSELRSHGFRVVEAENFQEARKAYLRRRPAAILVHVDSSRSAADAFCRYVREETGDADTALLALTRRNEPSFLLNLMDTWFNDVLPTPIDAPVAVARISRVLSAREKGTAGRPGKGFSATFKDLSFIDLVQTLGSGGRNARMVVEGPGGRRAEICFREGKIVFAVAGEASGPAAVYQVIRWQAEGSFRVETAASFPETNVTLPTDYILLEGLRRLDEGLAGRGA